MSKIRRLIPKKRPPVSGTGNFRIIPGDHASSHCPPGEFAVISNAMQATGDFTLAADICFHPRAMEAGLAAIRAGKDILVDSIKVAGGISRNKLDRFGGQVICRIAEPETALLETNIGIVVVGSEPSTLLKVIALIEEQRFAPDLVIGVPMGLSPAVDCRQLLARQDYPFITTLGRSGGTPVALAMITTLLELA